ncbi:hypothetical protein ACU6RU_12815 [Microbacterium sp. F1-18]
MFKRHQNVGLGAGIATLAVSALLAASPASAVSLEARNSEETELRTTMTALGVDAADQDALIDKSNSGIAWDSFAGAEPTESTTAERDGYRVTTDRFADGSVIETGIELGREATAAELAAMIAEAALYLEPEYDGDYVLERATAEGVVAPMASGIDNCRFGYSAGVRYADNCHVYYHGISASNSFDANYQQWSGGSSAQYIAGSAKFVSLPVGVSNEQVNTYDGGTRIRYSFNTHMAGWGNVPGFLQLKVTSTSAVVTYG